MLRVVFMGTPEFSIPSLIALHQFTNVLAVYTQPDRPVGRGLEMKFSPVKAKAIELGLPVFQSEKLTLPGEYEKLHKLNPDVIVVVAYGQILKRNVLNLPRLGCVNIHSSLLPRWRGAAPIQWSILSGDQKTGVTTMHLVEKLDAGDILLQKETLILKEDTASTVHDRLAQMGAELIIPTLMGLDSGELQGTQQADSEVTYASKLSKEMEWLNPNESAEALERRVRALQPWPGTSLSLGQVGQLGQRLRIKSVKVHKNLKGPVGQIFEQAGMVLLGTALGSLELRRMQWEGKKEIDPAAFLNGLKGRGQALPISVLPVSV